MSIFTLKDLAEALGPAFELKPMGEDGARVLRGGGDVAFIDLAGETLETEIRVTGYAADETPDLAGAAAVIEEVRDTWESAGFGVDETGNINSHWCPADPETRFPHVDFTARYSFSGLADAVRALKWLDNADTMLQK